MKYTKEERNSIGREIYTRQITVHQAAEKYSVDPYTARGYMRCYRDINGLPPMSTGEDELKILHRNNQINISELESMTKSDLINEVIKSRVEVERAKKGYKVKGGGAKKEFVNILETSMK